MKYFNKLGVFFVFMLFSHGVDTFAYTYTVANMSGRDVKVRLHYMFGTLNKNDGFIEADDTREFSFGGLKSGLCLSKMVVSSFNEDKKKWIKLSVPIKIIDRELFNETKDVIERFSKIVSELVAATGQEESEVIRELQEGKVVDQEEAVEWQEAKKWLEKKKESIRAVVDIAPRTIASIQDIWAISFCRSRDFILVLDHDPQIKMDRIYALSPVD